MSRLARVAIVIAGCSAEPSYLDPAFGDGGRVRIPMAELNTHPGSVATGELSDLALISEDSLAVAYDAFGAMSRFDTRTGELDTSFGIGGTAKVVVAYALPMKGGIVLARPDRGHYIATARGETAEGFRMYALTPEGDADPSRSSAGELLIPELRYGHHAAIDDGGHVLVAGESSSVEIAFASIGPDGTRVTTFGENGVATLGPGVAEVAMHDNGGVLGIVRPDLALPTAPRPWIVRLTPTGQLDPSLSGPVELAFYTAATVLREPSGSVLVAGGPLRVQCLTPAWTPCPGFGIDGVTAELSIEPDSNHVATMWLQRDGALLVAGGTDTHYRLARYKADGQIDLAFGAGGIIEIPHDSEIIDAVQLADGSVIFGARHTPSMGVFELELVKVKL